MTDSKTVEGHLRVRCATCRRTLGLADSPTALRNKIFCDELCAAELPATPNEARNDQWKAMALYGWSPVLIGKKYHVTHSQVYKAIAR